MLGSKAVTRMQSIALVAIIIVAAIVGVVGYILLGGQNQTSETIKIGVLADLDNIAGRTVWQEVVLAAEQVNANGGVLGRNFEVVAEDDDSESGLFDTSLATSALTRLITVDKADFIVNSGRGGFSSIYQEIVCQHNKILLDGNAPFDELTQKVLEDYEKYKYYFRVGIPNSTSLDRGVTDTFLTFRENTGLNKVAIIFQEYMSGVGAIIEGISDSLTDVEFDVVYTARISLNTVDFTSYFAAAEAAGAEISYCVFVTPAGLPFVLEYYNRQSPMILFGTIQSVSESEGWELTDGACEYITVGMYPPKANYPLTTKTIPFRDAYTSRWNTTRLGSGAFFDVVKYILPDAIERAGTIETDAVIEALEATSIETSLARNFKFTTGHDIMIGENPNDPDNDYYIAIYFQWQDGNLVPVYPKKIMQEAGAIFKFPDWLGPWD